MIRAGTKRHLEAAGTTRAGPGGSPGGPGAGRIQAGSGDSAAIRLPGQGWAGKVLLSLSVAGLPLVLFALRRSGRRGGLLVEAGCGVLFARDLTMAATGMPAKLRPVPRLLLLAEVGVSGVATLAGLPAWVRRSLPQTPPPAPPSRRRAPGAAHRARPGGEAAAAARRQAAVRVATVAAATTFALHTAREAIYLSPGHGRRDQT